MKTGLPLLVICLLGMVACTNSRHPEVLSLKRELAATPLLSAAFDSLLQQTRTFTASQRVDLLLSSAAGSENESELLAKQESLLLEALPLATPSERKQTLLHLAEVYSNPNNDKILHAAAKAIKRCEELEQGYTLSNEERWRVMEIKASALDGEGSPDIYMPIWFQLLEEHRKHGDATLIIKDLSVIANYSNALGGQEKALALYQEAYELSIRNKLPEQQKQSLIHLIYFSLQSGRCREALNLFYQEGTDSMLLRMPNSYSFLAQCYTQLNKPDSARFFLHKERQNSRIARLSPSVCCDIARTFVTEQREDSATAYLNRARALCQNSKSSLPGKGTPHLPFTFLEVYSEYASLLWHNGKIEEAGEAFAFIEPLTKSKKELPSGQKSQIDALTRYAAYCRTTRQHEKGFELMLRCDSLRNAYNANREKRTNTGIVEQFKVQEALYAISLQNLKLNYSKRILFFVGGLSFILLAALLFLFHLYRERRKQLSAIFSKNQEIEQLHNTMQPAQPQPVPVSAQPAHAQTAPGKEEAQSPVDQLYRAAQKRVTTKKIYLDPELSLEQLARELNTNRSYLSSCINTCSGGNFNQWINNLRIGYAIKHIQSAANDLPKLAKEAGFLSTDAFVRNFKRCTQLTPTQYLKENSNTTNPAK